MYYWMLVLRKWGVTLDLVHKGGENVYQPGLTSCFTTQIGEHAFEGKKSSLSLWMQLAVPNFCPFFRTCTASSFGNDVHYRIYSLLSSNGAACGHCSRMPRPYPLIQTDPYRIHRVNPSIKCSFEVAMCTQALLDKPTTTSFGP